MHPLPTPYLPSAGSTKHIPDQYIDGTADDMPVGFHFLLLAVAAALHRWQTCA